MALEFLQLIKQLKYVLIFLLEIYQIISIYHWAHLMFSRIQNLLILDFFTGNLLFISIYIVSMSMWYITQWKMLGRLENIYYWNCFPDQFWSFKSLKAWLEKELYQYDGQFHLLLLTYQFLFYYFWVMIWNSLGKPVQ